MNAICLQCNKDFVYGYSSTGKFCSNQCSGMHKKATHKQKFLSGLLEKIDRPTARRYIAEERGYRCEGEDCGLSNWKGNPITLQVDHINGDPSNNHPSNLRLLCPNCHSQTEFFSGANKGRGRGSLGIAKY